MTNLNRLLFRKDHQALRGWVRLAWAAWLPFLLFPLTVSSNGEATQLWFYLLQAPGVVVVILTVARLVQMDPLIGSTAYLGTRPVTRLQLVAGKALFAVLMLGLPVAVLRTAVLFLLSHQPDTVGMLGVLVDQLVTATTLVAVPFVVARWTTRLHSFLLVLIGGLGGFMLALSALQRTVSLQFGHRAGFNWYVFAAGGIVFLLLQARLRRVWPAVAVLVATPILAILAAQIPTRASTRPASVANPAAPPGISLIPDSRRPFALIRETVGQRAEFDRVDLSYRLEGLASNERLDPGAIQAVVRTRGGRRLDYHGSDTIREGIWMIEFNEGAWQYEEEHLADAFRQIMGLDPAPGPFRPNHPINVFRLPSAEGGLQDDPVAHIEGTIGWTRYRYRVAAHLPLQAGARAAIGFFQIRLDQVISQPNSVSAGLVLDGVLSATMAGGQDPSQNHFCFLVVQDGRILTSNSGRSTGGDAMGDYVYWGEHMTFGVPSRQTGENSTAPALPPRVTPGLYVLVADLAGQFTLPFEADAPP